MKLKSVDISQTSSAASIVFEALRSAIVEGDLKDGEPLRQDEIARMFNTSRIPVREAISRLEEQGLVKSIRYKGAVVAGLSLSEATEVFEFRAVLEAEVIKRAVPKMDTALLRKARTYCEDFAASPNVADWGDLNRKFHAALYSASGLEYHTSVLDNAMDRIDRYLRAQLVMSDQTRKVNEEHLAILEACEAGQSDAAAQLTRAHIESAKASLEDHLANG